MVLVVNLYDESCFSLLVFSYQFEVFHSITVWISFVAFHFCRECVTEVLKSFVKAIRCLLYATKTRAIYFISVSCLCSQHSEVFIIRALVLSRVRGFVV